MTDRRRWPRALALALSTLSACADGETPASDRAPNVVLVVLDTLRAGHLELYGYEHETAPFLAQVAANGTLFQNAYSSSSWTAPATASLVTGLYPDRHGIVAGFFAHVLREEDKPEESIELSVLPRNRKTIAEVLQSRGYATYGLAANVNVGPEMGFDRGFDRFERSNNESAKEMRQRLLAWRDEMQSGAPYFLYLHLNDAHHPYKPHPPYLRSASGELAESIARYDSEIGYVDAVLSRLWQDFGWGENTLVLFVSDHGEEFEDHGNLYHLFSLYQELNRILLLVHGPAQGVEAGLVEENVSVVDVLPTLVDLAGLEVPGDGDGTSLAPLARAGTPRDVVEEARATLRSRPIFAHRTDGRRHLWAIVREKWKLIRGPDGAELYDLEEDPGERNDLHSVHPELAARLAAELDAQRGRGMDVEGERTEVRIDAELLEQLKTLGYVK